MDFTQITVQLVAAQLGINADSLLLLLFVLYAVGQLVGRLIPDDATGILAGIRRVAKVVSLTVPYQVTKGVSLSDVARGAMAQGIQPLDRGEGPMTGALEVVTKADLAFEIAKAVESKLANSKPAAAKPRNAFSKAAK